MKQFSKCSNFDLVASTRQPGFTILRRSSGFTIVELLVVVVVIGILAAITIVSYTGITSRAKLASVQSDLSNNTTQLKLYQALNGSFPATLVNNCPDTPVADTTHCLKISSDNKLAYVPATGTSPQDFRLTVSDTTTTTNYSTNANGLNCPLNFIIVPGSATYGTNDFCVMKYEAKIQGNDNGAQTYNTSQVPESRATGTPWVNISQTNSITESQTICSTCHLITEVEWLTIAQNVVSVPSNWSSGIVGTGYIYRGHSDNVPSAALAATTDDTDGYYGTGQTTTEQKRTLTLSNGEVIWDMAGNVYDWTAGQTTNGQPGMAGEVTQTFKQWNAITAPGSLAVNATPAFGILAASAWTTANSIGMLGSNAGDTALRGFLRGDKWDNGAAAGIFALRLNNAPNGRSYQIGFRVAATS